MTTTPTADETTEETAAAAPKAAPTSTTWAALVATARVLASRPDAWALLAVVALTKGHPNVEIPIGALAEDLDVSESTVKSTLGRLESAGWVRREAVLVDGAARLQWVTTMAVR